MNVQMEHALPGVIALVDYKPIAALKPQYIRKFGYLFKASAEHCALLLRHLGKQFKVAFGDAQKMIFCLGVYVLYDYHILVLKHL